MRSESETPFHDGDFTIPVAGRVRRLPPYLFGRINALKQRKRAEGVDVIDLGMGNPTDPPDPLIRSKLAEAVEDPRNHRYSVSSGIANLRREVAARYWKRYGVRLDPDGEVIACIGSKEGFSHMCLALMGPGDTAIVPSPSFPIHVYSVLLASGNVISLDCRDPDAFLSNISYACEHLEPKPKVVIVNFPHNPTGAVLNTSELAAIGNLAHEHDFVIVVDEAYDSLVYDNQTHVSLATLDGMRERTITVQTCSKVYNMGGWRVGWIMGPADTINRIEAIQSTAISCPTSFAQAGVAAALNGSIGMGDEPIDQLLIRLAGHRDRLVGGLRQIPGISCVQASGGFFVFPNLSSFAMNSSDLSEHLLNDAGIVTVPGDAFGDHGQGHLRMLFTAPEEDISRGLELLTTSLAKLPHN